MLRWFAFLALAGFCTATHLEFPLSSGPKCILIDIEMMNSLTWTDASGNTTNVPDWDFTNSSTLNGNCVGNIRQLSQRFEADGAIYTFTFTDTDSQVSLVMSLTFNQDKVFKNGENSSVSLDTEPMQLSKDDKAFKCNSNPEQKASKTVQGNKYDMTVRLKEFHVQAFNVLGSNFSADSECEDDITTEMPNPSTKEPTTEPPKPTTQPPTTAAKNETTEPTTQSSPSPGPTTQAPDTNSHPKQTFSLMDSGVTCILMTGQFLFTIPYPGDDGTMKSASVGLHDVSVNETVGSCKGTETNTIQITFLNNITVKFTFKSDVKTNLLQASDDTKYWWDRLDLAYELNDEVFPNHNKSVVGIQTHSKNFSSSQFQATVAGSYLCDSDSTLDLGEGFKLETWDLQYNAFQSTNQTKFSDDNIQECTADTKTNSIVPIAVGAALAGLVVIVLIAYLIGRRRNRKGYESV